MVGGCSDRKEWTLTNEGERKGREEKVGEGKGGEEKSKNRRMVRRRVV